MKDKAKESNDGKDAKKLRNTFLKSVTVVRIGVSVKKLEVGLRIIEDKWGTGDWTREPVEKWE